MNSKDYYRGFNAGLMNAAVILIILAAVFLTIKYVNVEPRDKLEKRHGTR
jgi:hypothetical protein